jgi:hypothetical protein
LFLSEWDFVRSAGCSHSLAVRLGPQEGDLCVNSRLGLLATFAGEEVCLAPEPS